MTRSLEWSDLQFFVAVCERGSIGGAAQALGVNHSTVLRRIANLETTLDVRLFDRLPRGYALTSHGQALAAGVNGVQEQLDAAQRRVTVRSETCSDEEGVGGEVHRQATERRRSSAVRTALRSHTLSRCDAEKWDRSERLARVM